MRRPDPHRALLRALAIRYPALVVLASKTVSWASATFTGARHELTCSDGVALDDIGEAEFNLPGHLLADVTVVDGAAGVTIEALTIELD